MRTSALTLLALLLTLPSFVSAQTADGVGVEQPDDDAAPSLMDVDAAAAAIEDLQDYEQRFYQLSLRSWGIYTPGLFLDGRFERHTNMWEDGVRNFAHGLEFTTRIPEKYDLVISMDWADLRTAEGLWVESGDPNSDANWTESTLSLLTADVSFHWLTNLNRQQTLQIYYGLGLGAAIMLGEFKKTRVDTSRCFNPNTQAPGWTFDERQSQDRAQLANCFDENDDPLLRAESSTENLPPLLPAISATVGFRGLISDRISLAVETGFKTLYFYGGIELGYFWGTRI